MAGTHIIDNTYLVFVQFEGLICEFMACNLMVSICDKCLFFCNANNFSFVLNNRIFRCKSFKDSPAFCVCYRGERFIIRLTNAIEDLQILDQNALKNVRN